ncbi:hypothetical protein [Shewanella profunda]|uniref:hypothetical protein n=1 Tax=Shewanella profunda TaxID=254793 RepID=UPI0035DDE1F6
MILEFKANFTFLARWANLARLPTNAEKGLFTGITKANTGAIHPFGQGKNA